MDDSTGPGPEHTNGASDGERQDVTTPGSPDGGVPGAERDAAEGDRDEDLPAGAETA